MISHNSQFIYAQKLTEFITAIDNNSGAFVEGLVEKYRKVIGRRPAESEISSWQASLIQMQITLKDQNLPGDCGILVEFKLANSGCRIDFVIAGMDGNGNRNFVIIELKRWSRNNVKTTSTTGTFFIEGGNYESNHPSEQANDYKMQMELWCEPVYNGRVKLKACSYLHNFVKDANNPLEGPDYIELLEETPMFLSNDRDKLRQFIKKYVGKGNGCDILYEIRNGEIKPSPKLIDAVRSMFDRTNKDKGTYILLDMQKTAYRKIKDSVLKTKKKDVIIVNGGPGTGKSVVAMNVLVDLLSEKKKVLYTTPNESFRTQIESSLIDIDIDERNAKTIFCKINDACADKFIEETNQNGEKIEKKIIEDAILVDEAHLLKKPKVWGNRSEKSQVWNIIDKSVVSVFFIDDRQVLNLDEIGTVSYIREEAKKFNIEPKFVRLDKQFRCSGSDEYVMWLDDLLMINKERKISGWNGDFKFDVFSDPNELVEKILQLKSSLQHPIFKKIDKAIAL